MGASEEYGPSSEETLNAWIVQWVEIENRRACLGLSRYIQLREISLTHPLMNELNTHEKKNIVNGTPQVIYQWLCRRSVAWVSNPARVHPPI